MLANRLPHLVAALLAASALAATGTATAAAASHGAADHRSAATASHGADTRTARRAKIRQLGQATRAKSSQSGNSTGSSSGRPSVSISAPVTTPSKSSGGSSASKGGATPTGPTAPVTTPVSTPVEPPAPSAPESPLVPPAAKETAPIAPTSPSTPAAGLTFNGAAISNFWLNQSAPGAVTEVADPAGGPEKVIKMTVSDQDVAPITPTENPRAQLLSPDTIEPGQEFWWSGKFFLPVEGFPASVPQWLNIIEGAYGAPWNGTPPFEIEAVGKTLRWQRNGTYNWDIPWEMPLERGKWITYLVHEKLATNGFIELWMNGKQITFFAQSSHNPDHEGQTTKLNMETLDQSNNGGPNFVVIQNYRKVGMFQSVTLYHGAMKLGATRASVE